MGTVTVGMDVGQKVDPTAIAVVELEWRPRPPSPGLPPGLEDYHIVRHLERLPLGTSYPQVAARLAGIVQALQNRGTAPRAIYVDATGVGQPVVDLLSQGGVAVVAVYFTHGDRRTEQEGYISLGKGWLVSRLQALLQTGRLLLPKTAEAQMLAKELLDYEIHVDEDANDTYGAFKVGTHDDMVTAVGLAVQKVEGVEFRVATGGQRPVFTMPAFSMAPSGGPRLGEAPSHWGGQPFPTAAEIARRMERS